MNTEPRLNRLIDAVAEIRPPPCEHGCEHYDYCAKHAKVCEAFLMYCGKSMRGHRPKRDPVLDYSVLAEENSGAGYGPSQRARREAATSARDDLIRDDLRKKAALEREHSQCTLEAIAEKWELSRSWVQECIAGRRQSTIPDAELQLMRSLWAEGGRIKRELRAYSKVEIAARHKTSHHNVLAIERAMLAANEAITKAQEASAC